VKIKVEVVETEEAEVVDVVKEEAADVMTNLEPNGFQVLVEV
jgi:hypothetical protein